ncbi:DUF5304 domain-containing protein [Streptomyces sp. LP05-1]|uniref:DUF5304 domain-containing protein n=1 Tax=Streptomyces pyxinae TaxID=2970734 RepID=A0ABT2CG13_9ACTN|nr:DUF5304 domain-containing protein [Streptomyces sp. LP05-1]MCS0636358.1 DUF5304 domain-containing protein [Streptomyces sp. LP05-1]
MSDATERPSAGAAGAGAGRGAGADFDADAWARACAEDLAAEKARRRGQSGPPPGAAAEELRKLVDAVADKVAGLRAPLLGAGAQSAVRQLVEQTRSAVEPVIERNPQVFDHLAAAGNELLAAYRSAVTGQETRWTRGTHPGSTEAPGPEPRETGAPDAPRAPGASGGAPPGGDPRPDRRPDRRDDGPDGGSEHIDLD